MNGATDRERFVSPFEGDGIRHLRNVQAKKERVLAEIANGYSRVAGRNGHENAAAGTALMANLEPVGKAMALLGPAQARPNPRQLIEAFEGSAISARDLPTNGWESAPGGWHSLLLSHPNEYLELRAFRWNLSRTRIHDHGSSDSNLAGAFGFVFVIEGSILEERFTLMGTHALKTGERVLNKGEWSLFNRDAPSPHRIEGLTQDAISLHVYVGLCRERSADYEEATRN